MPGFASKSWPCIARRRALPAVKRAIQRCIAISAEAVTKPHCCIGYCDYKKFNLYSPSTSKTEQDESVEGCPMNRHTCREEYANAQDDGEQEENDRNAIAVRHIVNDDSGCLAYPSASAGYREDCAENGAGRLSVLCPSTIGRVRRHTCPGLEKSQSCQSPPLLHLR